MSNRENGSENGGSANNRPDGQQNRSYGSSGQRKLPRINPEAGGYGTRNTGERFTAPRESREPGGYGYGEEQGRSSAFRDREGRRTRTRTGTVGRNTETDRDPRSAGSGRSTSGTGRSGAESGRNPSAGRNNTASGSGRSGATSGRNSAGRTGADSGRNTSSGRSGANGQTRGGRNTGRGSGSNGRGPEKEQSVTPDQRSRYLIPEVIVTVIGIALLLILLIPLGKTLFHTDPVAPISTGSAVEPDTLLGEKKISPIPTKPPVETEEETETTTEEYRIDLSAIPIPDFVTVDLIEPNEFSRPEKPLKRVNDIVVHYVGNPGTSAAANVGYFKQLGNADANPEGHKASSNFVIGLQGEVIMCVPIDEVAYCSNNRNSDTISIECCHPDEEGKFTDATYVSLVKLLNYLCNALELDENHIIRHYDVTGKECPRYYVRNPEAWDTLKLDLRTSLDAHPVNDGSWY